jgi:hypothetical protein
LECDVGQAGIELIIPYIYMDKVLRRYSSRNDIFLYESGDNSTAAMQGEVNYDHAYIAYKFWSIGFSCEVWRPIKSREASDWGALLDVSRLEGVKVDLEDDILQKLPNKGSHNPELEKRDLRGESLKKRIEGKTMQWMCMVD